MQSLYVMLNGLKTMLKKSYVVDEVFKYTGEIQICSKTSRSKYVGPVQRLRCVNSSRAP